MNDSIIVALDTGASEAIALARALQGRVRWLKVGMTLFYAEGPQVVSGLADMGFDIFLDLKLHDIPHQVRGAARTLAGLGARMLTVHTSGGRAMMEAAVAGARDGAADAGVDAPAVIGVTVLTSLDAQALADIGCVLPPAEQALSLAALARDAGMAGVVCSPLEAASMRSIVGSDGLVVTPGIRPSWSASGDQARIATPAEAIAAGASHLVIGRPITESPDPAVAVDRIMEELL